MPFRILVWNIERFGTRRLAGPQRHVAEALRCSLVEWVVHNSGANVLVIQELRRSGVHWLEQLCILCAKRGGEWNFRWIGGSLMDGGGDGFHTRGNSEGYGVLWQRGALQPLPNNPERFIDLVLQGVAYNASRQGQPPIFFGEPVTEANLGFPQSHIPDLAYEGEGINLRRVGDRDRALNAAQLNRAIFQTHLVRRPCHVLLNVPDGRPPVPLVVYHAPVNGRSPYFGTLIGFASGPLQPPAQTPAQNHPAIYAGDFNITDHGEQEELLTYTRTQRRYDVSTYRLGRPMTSMIHYWNKQYEQFRRGEAVYTSGRDYAFVRSAGRCVSASIYNVLVEQMDDLRGFADDLRNILPMNQGQFENMLRRQVEDPAVAIASAYVFGRALPDRDVADVNTVKAILYRALLSDHLPVLIEYP